MVLNAIVSIIAILALAFIEWCMLEHNIDGTIAILTVTAIAGLGGYNAKKILDFLKAQMKGGS